MARDVLTETASIRSRAVWSSGDYADVADRLLPDLGAILVGAADVRPGARVLDVAAGAGNVAIAAAAGAGADVVALDVTPELLQAGRRVAERRGVTLDWVEGDAAQLPFEDATFDTVLSCVGVMFVPDHQRAADELLRVCRRGGTIGLLSWTPEGFIGELFRTLGPFASPPPGTLSPALWGQESHLLELFGDGVEDVRSRTGIARNDSFETPDRVPRVHEAGLRPDDRDVREGGGVRSRRGARSRVRRSLRPALRAARRRRLARREGVPDHRCHTGVIARGRPAGTVRPASRGAYWR